MSTSESKAVEEKLTPDFHICYAAGAGYKVLTVVDSLVGAYVLSQASTFKWDTCSPHAVLLAMGGDLVDFSKALEAMKANQGQSDEELMSLIKNCAVKYDQPDKKERKGGDRWSNTGGIIAYTDINKVLHMLHKLQ